MERRRVRNRAGIVPAKKQENKYATTEALEKYYERIRNKMAQRRRSNPERNRDIRRAYSARHNSNPIFRLKGRLRGRIRDALKSVGLKKRKSATKTLGCSIEFLKQYLEARFKEGMTWGNYAAEWHIDHVKPFKGAKTLRDVERLCHYTNLQPLWKNDNLRKSSKEEKQMALGL